jgi:thermostable 8-oxoguanine DNA glycosylase
MINPAQVTNYQRTDCELQEFLLFCICVSGKRSAIEAPKLDAFLSDNLYPLPLKPFMLIKYLDSVGKLERQLKKHRISPYGQRLKSFRAVSCLTNLDSIGVTELNGVPGIGLKTSRFFLSHSRKGFDEPMLDTHILKYLRDNGYVDAPKSTPQNSEIYSKFANAFRSLANRLGKSVTDLDLEVWKKYSGTT